MKNSLESSTKFVQRRRRTIRFVTIVSILLLTVLGTIAFLISQSGTTNFAADMLTNLVSEFIGALMVAWLLQGVLTNAASEMQDELAAIRESDAELEERLIEAEAKLREAEVRAEEAEERAATLTRVVDQLQGYFSHVDVQKSFGKTAGLFSGLLNSIKTDTPAPSEPEKKEDKSGPETSSGIGDIISSRWD